MSNHSPNSFVLIKLGGSVITQKDQADTLRSQVLDRLVAELSRAQAQMPETQFVVGHGHGGFAHRPAAEYQVPAGFTAEKGPIGMVKTLAAVSQLHQVVLEAMLAHGLPAASFRLANTLVTHQTQPAHWDGAVFHAYLERGILPVTCGDVMADTAQGCSLWSTEMVLGFLADDLRAHQQPVTKIIHVTETAGVLDAAGQTVPVISRATEAEAQALITTTKGVDVSGGMWHKIEESLLAADQGIESDIITGLEPDNLYRCLLGQPFAGTRVVPS